MALTLTITDSLSFSLSLTVRILKILRDVGLFDATKGPVSRLSRGGEGDGC